MTETNVPEKLLIGACGSIAILTLPAYIQAFRYAGVGEITVVLTPSAERLIPATTLRYICDGVCTESRPGPGHIALARSADAVAVAPATAHLLACAAQGAAPNLLSTLLIAVSKPVVFAPIMNSDMWRSPAVGRNVAQLRADGHHVLDPLPGSTFEVASRTIRQGMVLPPPEHFLKAWAAGAPNLGPAPEPDGPGR